MISKYSSIYFVGAGGIGMAALERYFLAQGKRVAGYDLTPSDLTSRLIEEGVEIVFDDDASLIPPYCQDAESTLVCYTPAVPASHKGLTYFRQNGFRVVKRSELLGIITRSSLGLCFSGTHGKTTTRTMAAHILTGSHIGCNAFLGGVCRNTGSNLMLSDTSPYTVIEADEFDRSFHTLSPHIAVVTATDPDHLDIYGTEEAYLESFAHFTSLIQPGGTLIVHTGLKLVPRTGSDVTTLTYSRDAGDFHAENVRKANGEIVFDFVAPGRRVSDISLGVPVDINIENAVAAMAVCALVGATDDELRQGIATFQGAKRRFEFWIKQPGESGLVMIDDYAHHPDELKASITSVVDLYPGREITVVFQPHLFTRTRDFAPEFAQALSLAHRVILLDIYPARELPIAGVTSEIILNRIPAGKATLCSLKQLPEVIKAAKPDILLTAGAGNVSNSLPEILEAYKQSR